jgi:hypothetical protein
MRRTFVVRVTHVRCEIPIVSVLQVLIEHSVEVKLDDFAVSAGKLSDKFVLSDTDVL